MSKKREKKRGNLWYQVTAVLWMNFVCVGSKNHYTWWCRGTTNWCFRIRTWGYICNTDCLPNAGPTSITCGPMPWEHSTVIKVYNKFVWVVLGFIEILISNIFFKSKKSEKNTTMICVIHDFITKLKTKIDVLTQSRFKFSISIQVIPGITENERAHTIYR